MSIGSITVRSELATQAKRLEALNLQISDVNVSENFLFETAPKQLQEIEEEVRSIVNRSGVLEMNNNYSPWERHDNDNRLRERRDSVKESVNATRIALLKAQQGSAQLSEQDLAIRKIYASQEGVSVLKQVPGLTSKSGQSVRLFGTSPPSFTNNSSSSSIDSSFLK